MNDGSPHELSAAYALDALDGNELRVYEEHLAGCERCREDVESFRATAAALAYDIDLPPLPETLEHRILDAARSERANVVPLPRRWAIPAAAVSIAAAAAAIVLAVWAVHLSNSLDREKAQRKSQAALLAILSDCTPTPTQGASGRVCVSPTHKAVLAVDGLEPAGAGKTYEAWVIAGKQVEPAGLFQGGPGRKYLRLTKPVPDRATVGVTLERAGGSRTPTLPMVVKAEVRPS
jgi:3-dehydroquinate dehydratase